MSPVVNRKSIRFWQKILNILKISVFVLIFSAEMGAFADNLVVRTAGTLQDGLFQTVSNSNTAAVSEPSIILEDTGLDAGVETGPDAEKEQLESRSGTEEAESTKKELKTGESSEIPEDDFELILEDVSGSDGSENAQEELELDLDLTEKEQTARSGNADKSVNVETNAETKKDANAEPELVLEEAAVSPISEGTSVLENGANGDVAPKDAVGTSVPESAEREDVSSNIPQTVSPSVPPVTDPAAFTDLREDAIVRAIRTARPAVVNIRGEKVLRSVPFDASNASNDPNAAHSAAEESQHVNGMGTGVIFDPRGYIVTNFHVVDGIQEIHVTTADAKTYVARILARDKETDLAIIKIDALAGEVFETIPLGESSDLMTGETVIAIGNAFGYEHTVTRGIISAQHRSVQVTDVQYYQDLIQTDASINPGNSGGPLLNVYGKMIGINVAVRAGAQGIGFAIPVNRAMEVVTRMTGSCSAEKNWHGIQFVNLPVGNGRGAVVQSVEPNSPAEFIGLRAGDTILAVNQKKIAHELDFTCSILELKPGESIQISVQRKNKTASVELALGAVSSKNRVASIYAPDGESRPRFDAKKLTNEEIIWKQMGVLVSPVAGNSIPIQGSRKYNGGLLVQNVRQNSPAARQGIQNGDILLGILRWETLSLDNVIFVLSQPEIQDMPKVKFLLARNGKVLLGHFPSHDFQTNGAVETASAGYRVRK